MKERKEMKNGDGRRNEKERNEVDVYIKIENVHFNPPGKLAFKSNSFSCNCNLVRKLIPNED